MRRRRVTKKEESVKAIIHVRREWVETSGLNRTLMVANALREAGEAGEILAIPVSRIDTDDNYFVEATFYPTALKDQSVKFLTIRIPKQHIVLILDVEEENITPLGYRPPNAV
jgi:hypothetical protein